MRILHVVLGNPYTHQGGLCRYCQELMESQKKSGEEVSVLYPREYLTGKAPKIIKKKRNEYFIFDSLPVAITYGVGEPERYTVSIRTNVYMEWLKQKKFEIIHVHSIQGVHKEFFDAAKMLGIPMVFTTHDYYSFCLRSILVDNEMNLCYEHTAEKCTRCNFRAGLSANKQRIIQSNIYQQTKSCKVIKSIKKNKSVSASGSDYYEKDKVASFKLVENYEKIINYYSQIMDCISLIHCNSSVSAHIYSLNYPEINQRIVPITHSGLTREAHKRKADDLHIGYMGGMSAHKGYKLLYEALNILDSMGCRKWIAHFYGGEFTNQIDDERYHYGGFFTSDEEDDVWDTIDVLVVGSQWWETFGFIVLEALCKGIPVLCSDLVGAKDLVNNIDKSLIIDHLDAKDIASKIKRLMDPVTYKTLITKIHQADLPINMQTHEKEIKHLYEELLNR